MSAERRSTAGAASSGHDARHDDWSFRGEYEARGTARSGRDSDLTGSFGQGSPNGTAHAGPAHDRSGQQAIGISSRSHTTGPSDAASWAQACFQLVQPPRWLRPVVRIANLGQRLQPLEPLLELQPVQHAKDMVWDEARNDGVDQAASGRTISGVELGAL